MNTSVPTSAAFSSPSACEYKHVAYSSSTSLMDIAVRLNNVGVACMESSEFADAEECFQRALAKTSVPTSPLCPSSPSKFRPIDAEGGKGKRNLYVFQREEYDEGMSAFSEPMAIDMSCKADLLDNDIEATILYNVGQLCIRLEDNEEALESFCLALRALRWHNAMRGSRAHDVIAIAILHNIGHLRYRTGMYDEAVRTYTRALQAGRNSAHKLNLEVAASLNCLGVLYFHQPKNKSGSAMDVFVDSLAIRRASLGGDHKDVATTLNNIGRVHYMRGEFVIALATYHEALLLLGDDHLDVGATVYNTGQTHHQLGDLEKAMGCYREFWHIATL